MDELRQNKSRADEISLISYRNESYGRWQKCANDWYYMKKIIKWKWYYFKEKEIELF